MMISIWLLWFQIFAWVDGQKGLLALLALNAKAQKIWSICQLVTPEKIYESKRSQLIATE
jgi:hypothetical protein